MEFLPVDFWQALASLAVGAVLVAVWVAVLTFKRTASQSEAWATINILVQAAEQMLTEYAGDKKLDWVLAQIAERFPSWTRRLSERWLRRQCCASRAAPGELGVGGLKFMCVREGASYGSGVLCDCPFSFCGVTATNGALAVGAAAGAALAVSPVSALCALAKDPAGRGAARRLSL